MLLPLAWLVRCNDTALHRGWLDRMASDLLASQQEFGAIKQEFGTCTQIWFLFLFVWNEATPISVFSLSLSRGRTLSFHSIFHPIYMLTTVRAIRVTLNVDLNVDANANANARHKARGPRQPNAPHAHHSLTRSTVQARVRSCFPGTSR